ncbi:hypothetical protein J4413_00990 [Candidatus Woesearchaeota archaeon]|nr:hypothetical protein [Candidatus Woesearchaeota archaeon]
MKVLLGILLIVILVISGCSGSDYTKEQLDGLASCLKEKGVKEYGAFWCPNCAKQQKMFGSSYDIIKDGVYVECDPRGDDSQAELCIEKEVDKYPTWDFPNGERLIGVQQFEVLAEKSGCTL